VSPAAALRRPAPDVWCIAEIVAHLGYTEAHMLERLRCVVAEDNPTVPAIDDPGGHDLSRPLLEQLAIFVGWRVESITFLGGLEQREWGRPLVHARTGPTRLRDQVQAIVTHDNEHLEEIVRIRNTL
jgi:hypothetical protein